MVLQPIRSRDDIWGTQSPGGEPHESDDLVDGIQAVYKHPHGGFFWSIVRPVLSADLADVRHGGAAQGPAATTRQTG